MMVFNQNIRISKTEWFICQRTLASLLVPHGPLLRPHASHFRLFPWSGFDKGISRDYSVQLVYLTVVGELQCVWETC